MTYFDMVMSNELMNVYDVLMSIVEKSSAR